MTDKEEEIWRIVSAHSKGVIGRGEAMLHLVVNYGMRLGDAYLLDNIKSVDTDMELRNYPSNWCEKSNEVRRMFWRATPRGRKMYALHQRVHKEDMTDDQLMRITYILEE